MNQKEYDLIGGAIYRTRTVADIEGNTIKREAKRAALRLLVADLTGTLAHEYPKTFDQAKFLKACGMDF